MTVINTNMAANNTYRLMSEASDAAAKNMEKLSSGLRINRAADDAAGLSIAEGLKAQSNGLEVAARNISDAVSLAQTAEGGLSVAHDILQRMRDLAVQAGNDTNNEDARVAIGTEITQLAEELDRMGRSINFNGENLLGTATTDATDPDAPIVMPNSFTFQVGANGSTVDNSDPGNPVTVPSNDQITLDISTNLSEIATAIGTLDFDTAENAAAAIAALDGHIGAISSERSNMGAVQNRLEHTLKHVNVTAENLTNAESNIRDVDMAKEMVELSANNIKTQASQAMLAQANQSTQGILQLLR